MKLMACAVVAMSMLAGAAQAADWRIYSGDSEGVLAVDISSIRIGPRYRTAWLAQVEKVTSELGYDYALIRTEVDCVSETSARTTFTAYKEGGVNIHTSHERTPHRSHPPQSHGEAAIRAVCLADYFDEGTSDIGDLLAGLRV